jgi:hypothetical protein
MHRFALLAIAAVSLVALLGAATASFPWNIIPR